MECSEEKLKRSNMGDCLQEHTSWTSQKKLDCLLGFLEPMTDELFQIFSETLALSVNFNGVIYKLKCHLHFVANKWT